jgi:hypothetical protein
MLGNGQVLFAGAYSWAGISAELYDPATGTFVAASPMITPTAAATATILNDGTVLIAGGSYAQSVALVEQYDPAIAAFRPVGGMVSPRVWHTATLLNNGSVLVVGGSNGGSDVATAEVY